MSHEQQGGSDDWFTPKWVFDALDCVFDLDVAHPRDFSHTHVPAEAFLHEKALETPWHGFVWMNPPFGNGDRAKLLWMDRFFEHGNGIALTPDRTSAGWFQKCWHKATLTLFVTPKIKFIQPDGKVATQPSNGTVLWAAGEYAATVLRRAANTETRLGFIAVKEYDL